MTGAGANRGGADRVPVVVDGPEARGGVDDGVHGVDVVHGVDGRGRRPDRQSALACAGCALSAVGATAAALLWASTSRTRRHMGGGFEGEGTDYTVLVTELPLVLAAGAAAPALLCLLIALPLNRRR